MIPLFSYSQRVNNMVINGTYVRQYNDVIVISEDDTLTPFLTFTHINRGDTLFVSQMYKSDDFMNTWKLEKNHPLLCGHTGCELLFEFSNLVLIIRTDNKNLVYEKIK